MALLVGFWFELKSQATRHLIRSRSGGKQHVLIPDKLPDIFESDQAGRCCFETALLTLVGWKP